MSVPFADLGVPADLTDRLAQRGIVDAFPIQAMTLPDALAGRDLCGRAPTGSGKTLAFGLPLIARVGKARSRRPRALVLVPTRELAAQVRKELNQLAPARGRRVIAIYGGVGFGAQIEALRSGADVVVACPGRLTDLVAKKEVLLDEVDLVVVDEADRMADMGFLPDVRRLLDQTSPERQTLLFSATLDGDVDVLIRRYQKDPVRHELTGEGDEPSNRHVFWQAERTQRLALTREVVAAQWPALVFCRTKRGADRLASQLARDGITTAAIHGNRTQSQRERALAAFASGKVQALVATDIAARGIHVDGVACVVHFDPPGDEKDYVHRSGRTGRAGASGLVVSLVGRDQERETKALQGRLGMDRHVAPVDVNDLAATAEPTTRPVLQASNAPSSPGRSPKARPPRRNRNRPKNAGPGGERNRARARTGAPSATRSGRRTPTPSRRAPAKGSRAS